ncbi:MAG: M23 family metallopeptidase [Treponema sp.]|nr:M23 family metallopeptidase [Treponema sp.]
MNFFQRMTLFSVFSAVFFLVPVAWITPEDLIHVVGRGDTIYSISRFYSVNADELMRANNISDPSRLLVGARLRIPATASASLPSQGPALNLTDYRVVRGDTLFSIARNNGITLANLLEINRFSSNHVIRVGDIVKIPARNTQQTASVTSPPTQVAAGVYALRWPVTPKEIAYMTGQMGVVLEGETNESVKSLTQGNVISAGPWRKFGRVVIVESQGGYFYMYGGCETLSVNVGDRVLPGTEVGKLGVNTVSEKPQLFFMVFRNDTPIDPAKAPRAGSNGRT